MMQTECLVKTTASTRFTAKIRFLQIVRRSVGKLRTPGREEREGVEPEFDFVDRLEVGGRVYQPWEEAVEREHTSSANGSRLAVITFPAAPYRSQREDVRVLCMTNRGRRLACL